MRIVGYADRLSVVPADPISFMVSCAAPRYKASVVRLIHGHVDPAGPGFKSEPVASDIEGDHAGRHQRLRPGSFVAVEHGGALDFAASFTVQMWLWSTTPAKEEQTLVANGERYTLRLDAGRLELRVGDAAAAVPVAVFPRTWYFVAATYDAEQRTARLRLDPARAVERERATSVSARIDPSVRNLAGERLLIAAESVAEGSDRRPGRFYNGKIAAPRLFDRALSDDEIVALRDGATPGSVAGLAAAWDLSVGITTRDVHDTGPRKLHGRTVQMPMRGATGPRWGGTETAWRHAPGQYDAIHFHDDDLDDAGWDIDLTWRVPDDLRSGVYALHVTTDGEEDHIPFVVRPRHGRPNAKIALLLPTFSYLAYANEHMVTLAGMADQVGVKGDLAGYPSSPQDRYIMSHRLTSLYDTHGDGSGVCYSSWLRPLVNMRPKYEMAVLGTPHQFNADLMLVDWLVEQGYEFDVITDADLDAEGSDLVRPYNVVLSGTHCEYWSLPMLDAMEEYLTAGGRFMYLAGNGMYWVTALDPSERHTVEVRRRGPATRTWEPEPGEAHLSSNGELGGLWRYRGRSPQSWAGVGFTAAGGEARGRPFRRCPASFGTRVDWIFEGVGDEPIGDIPSLIIEHGAAAQEIDRLDHALGTPSGAILLASADGFSDTFQHVVEEVFQTSPTEGGTISPYARADMVLVPYPNGGAVFSASSIAWCGCLSYDRYRNTVSRVTANVVDRFGADGGWE